jgi:hypothetical protein
LYGEDDPVMVPKVALPLATPFTVKVKAAGAPVTKAVIGNVAPTLTLAVPEVAPFSVTTTEFAALTTKLTLFEGPPPGLGLVTTTARFPAVAWSPALKEIVHREALTNVAAWATPL